MFARSADAPLRAHFHLNHRLSAGILAMGATASTSRLDRVTALGFSVAEARLALEHTNGDVDRAILCLLAKRRQEASAGQGLANRVNAILRRQRSWPEFFDRFLWPEHLEERISTNLLYYEANYIILCSGVAVVSILLNPSLLFVMTLVVALVGGAAAWDGDVNAVAPQLGLPAPLALQQRLAAAGLGSSLIVNSTGHATSICRVALLCTGVVVAHAAFRARSLKSRFAFFQEELKQE